MQIFLLHSVQQYFSFTLLSNVSWSHLQTTLEGTALTGGGSFGLIENPAFGDGLFRDKMELRLLKMLPRSGLKAEVGLWKWELNGPTWLQLDEGVFSQTDEEQESMNNDKNKKRLVIQTLKVTNRYSARLNNWHLWTATNTFSATFCQATF